MVSFFFGGTDKGKQKLAVLFVEFGEVVLFQQVAEQTMVEASPPNALLPPVALTSNKAFGQLQYGYVECAAAQIVNDKRTF